MPPVNVIYSFLRVLLVTTAKRKTTPFPIYLFRQLEECAKEAGVSANEFVRQGVKREISIFQYTKMKSSENEKS